MADEPRGLPVPQATPGAAQNVGVAVPQIPGRLRGGTAIDVTQNGLNWTINLKIGELSQAPAHDFSKTWVPAWFDDTDATYRIALSDLSLSLPVAWDNITGKPPTFPPTLPIPSSGVTGLDAALASIAGDLFGLDSRLDAAEITIATHTGQIAAHETRLNGIDAKLVDSDRGDITTSASFMTWTIDAKAVTDAKLRDSSALSVIGRSVNSSGVPADIAAGTDGFVLRRAGTALGFGTVATAGVANDAITDAKLRNSGALSVIGRGANSTGDPADISAGTDGFVLRRSGTALAFGTVDTAGVTDDAITNSKLANMATARFKGRVTAATGDPEDLTGTQATTLLDAMVGDSGAGGTKGLVPAPAAGDAAAGKVLGAGGTWINPGGLPAGLIAAFMMTSAPTGWLKANGAAVDLSVYPTLIAIYCGNTDNPTALHGYRCTNPASPSSTRSTSGGYIVLPDFRGEFIRGLDDGRGVDTSRSAWQAQAELVAAHTHGVTDPGHNHTINDPTHSHSYVAGSNAAGTGTAGAAVQSANAFFMNTQGAATGISINNRVTSITVNANVGAENRPRNLAPLICIKY